MDTIKEAKEYLKENYETGCSCPACGQYVKIYKRKLNSSMAYALIIMKNLHDNKGYDTYLKMNEEIANLKIPSSNIEYAKLHYWGFITEKPNTNDKTKTSGYWKLTNIGLAFVINKTTTAKYVFIYNGSRQGVSDEKTTIQESLGDKFDYKELMSTPTAQQTIFDQGA